MTDLQVIPELPSNPYRLGRNREHDERSIRYAVPTVPKRVMSDVKWDYLMPVIDQGDLHAQGIHVAGDPDGLGSCTANTALEVLGTKPFWDTLPAALQDGLKDPVICERRAITIYREATAADEFDGQWPPTDTGSSGLAAAKVLAKYNLISRYDHAFGLDAMLSALQEGPVMCGTNWFESFFTPDSKGVISRVSGQVAGGHEYLCVGAAIDTRVLYFRQTWGTGWGLNGTFSWSFDIMDRLLSENGDCVVPRPRTA